MPAFSAPAFADIQRQPWCLMFYTGEWSPRGIFPASSVDTAVVLYLTFLLMPQEITLKPGEKIVFYEKQISFSVRSSSD